MAIEDVNKTGIRSLGGAKLEAMLGDAQSTPQAGTADQRKRDRGRGRGRLTNEGATVSQLERSHAFAKSRGRMRRKPGFPAGAADT